MAETKPSRSENNEIADSKPIDKPLDVYQTIIKEKVAEGVATWEYGGDQVQDLFLKGYFQSDELARLLQTGKITIEQFNVMNTYNSLNMWKHGTEVNVERKPSDEVEEQKKIVENVIEELRNRAITAEDEAENIKSISRVSKIGIPNQIAFKEDISHLESKRDTINIPISFLYLDADGLSDVNGIHGHKGGDVLLEDIGKILPNAVRQGDRYYHLSGDEFVVVLENTDGQAAEEVAKRITESLKEQLLPMLQGQDLMKDQSEPFTATIGLSTKPAGSPLDSEQLLEQADAAMFNAKKMAQDKYLKEKAQNPEAKKQKGLIVAYRPGMTNPKYQRNAA